MFVYSFKRQMETLITSIPDESNDGVVVPTEQLRAKLREYTRHQRDVVRANVSDSLRFGLGEITNEMHALDVLLAKDVKGMSVRIKRRRHATEEDMYRLCHAFLQSEANIVTFANAAAIPVLIKELTGHDATRQLCAAECLCNLSLGPPAVCDKLVSMAGSYLVTYLDCMEVQLKRTCLWTLANIMATGGKGASAMMHMELLPKLWTLYAPSDDDGADANDYCSDAGLTLQIISASASKLLRANDYEFLRGHYASKKPTAKGSEFHLQILFNCEILYHATVSMATYIIDFALHNLLCTPDFVNSLNQLRILYAVRMLGNLLANIPTKPPIQSTLSDATSEVLTSSPPLAPKMVLDELQYQLNTKWQITLATLLNRIFAFGVDELNNETFWLLHNILQQQQESVITSNFKNDLKIPKIIKTNIIEKI